MTEALPFSISAPEGKYSSVNKIEEKINQKYIEKDITTDEVSENVDKSMRNELAQTQASNNNIFDRYVLISINNNY